MTDGYSLTEIATELGQPVTWVSEKLASLRNELLLTSGLFFPLADHEFEALQGSIKIHGIQQPAIIGEHITLVDGRHRLLIANELGIDCPAIFLAGMTREQERDLSYALNTARRQLTRAQKRTLVEAELMRDPARSDRLIASVCGVSHVHVGDIRGEIADRQIAAQAEVEAITTLIIPSDDGVFIHTRTEAIIPELVSTLGTPPLVTVRPPSRIDRAGNTQTAREPVAASERPSPILGYVTCAHGQTHTLRRVNGDYRLTVDDD